MPPRGRVLSNVRNSRGNSIKPPAVPALEFQRLMESRTQKEKDEPIRCSHFSEAEPFHPLTSRAAISSAWNLKKW